MQSESEFSKRVVAFFRGKLSADKKFSDIKVDEEVNILKDFTVGKHKGKWRPVFGLHQQDIVFYKDTFGWERFGAEAFITNKGIRNVIVPILICELKIGENLITHNFLTYSNIAEHIKEIFPHCVYYFIMDSNKERGLLPETVLRQSKGFDRVFLEWVKEREIIWEDIRNHFNYLKRIGVV